MTATTLSSSIGKKAMMAASGILLLGFVIAHLAGTLLVFAGQDALNAYAEKLRHFGPWLWVARAGLLATAAVHVWVGIVLVRENRQARAVGYRKPAWRQTTAAARTMAVTGALLALYVVYHLMHFTFQTAHPALAAGTDPLGRADVYTMVVRSFQDARIALVYVAAMFFLALHLSHGIASTVQTLGLNTERSIPVTARIGAGIAVLIFLGYAAIPVAIFFGAVRLPGAG